MVELQIWEIWEKIQQIFRWEIEPWGASRDIRGCIFEVQSWHTRMLINNIFAILMILGVEKILEKQGAAEKGDIDF